MASTDGSTIFGAFNARQLSADEVGATFVAPAQFERLCQPEHTLLLGPRGSGKTTLLKMLTAPALRAWQRATGVLAARPAFHGVYIPADVLWTSQIEDLQRRGVDDQAGHVLSRAAVTTNVLYSFVEAVEQLPSESLSKEDLRACAGEIASGWRLHDAYPSFYGLRLALRSRLADIRTFVERAGPNQDREPATAQTPPPELYQDFLDALSFGLDVVQHHFAESRSVRWALCFDELEISPQWLQQHLLRALRSTDQRFLYKLSASPLHSLVTEPLGLASAEDSQDYSIVKLWYSGAAESREFCQRLTATRLSRAWNREIDPREALGSSAFASDEERPGSATTYRPGSYFWRQLQAGAYYDPSLRRLLKERDIDPSDPQGTSARDRDQFLRKIKPVLLLRNEFRVAGDEERKREVRTRKRSGLYAGAEALYAISDGNPRWLIGMLGEMIARSKSRGRIPAHVQSDVLWRSSQRFKALLGMIPHSSVLVRGKPTSVVDMLDSVGKYFFDRLVRGPFPLDPVASFHVDAAVGDDMVQLIDLAVRQGALVMVDSHWHVVARSARGKRFRLSFMLAPHYRLPLRLYDPIALSACVRPRAAASTADDEAATEAVPADAPQPDLFDATP